MSLTDRQVAALKPPDIGQKLYPEGSIPGFGLRVSQGGTKTFVLIVGDDRRKITIGRYPIVSLAKARDKAKSILAARQLGLDKPLSPRFEDVVEEFLAERDRKVRASTRSRDGYMLPLFKSLNRTRVSEIDVAEVQRILDRMTAPWTKHDACIRFGLVIQFAIKQGYVEAWPLHRLEASVVHVPRDRVLDAAELTQLLTTAKIWRLAGNQFGTIVELLACTGQRRQQIGSLNRAHVDFDQGIISWEPALMKTGRAHSIPLGDRARALLDPRRNGLYFPNLHGEPFSGWSINVRKFKRDLGFGDWCLHDLRRVVATGLQSMQVDIATTEKVLAHSSVTGGLVGVYQRHDYMREMRVALQKWENHVTSLNA